MKCKECNGKGNIKDGIGNWTTCEKCGGAGKVPNKKEKKKHKH